jgi:uncharacterized protein (DUF2147 family)
MRKSAVFSLVVFFAIICNAQSQSVIGKWKTVDDETGKPKSIVEIYEKSGKIYGKIVDILEADKKNKVCSECSGEEKNKPILGMVIIKGLRKEGNEYNDGQILDPKNGKSYKCIITLEGNDKLKLRGYIGVSVFGRTQYWSRVKG